MKTEKKESKMTKNLYDVVFCRKPLLKIVPHRSRPSTWSTDGYLVTFPAYRIDKVVKLFVYGSSYSDDVHEYIFDTKSEFLIVYDRYSGDQVKRIKVNKKDIIQALLPYEDASAVLEFFDAF